MSDLPLIFMLLTCSGSVQAIARAGDLKILLSLLQEVSAGFCLAVIFRCLLTDSYC